MRTAARFSFVLGPVRLIFLLVLASWGGSSENGGPAPTGHSLGEAPAAFFAMSTPSVWRSRRISSHLGLEALVDGVFLHELMHTRQFYFVTPRLAVLTRSGKRPEKQPPLA
ncbi:hypothetical protein CLV45_2389 [Hymenobacter chitinivorans DSM 11115]|uniref:Uncharacterized protein n=2 Tax=Hymenobacter chitinivorans TaxID=89969 RepID=A0A2M9BSS6_9BACT|nr:hypothetical protein CLV45_2389 [Hymenobacter chitinivorans DSM 11115]